MTRALVLVAVFAVSACGSSEESLGDMEGTFALTWTCTSSTCDFYEDRVPTITLETEIVIGRFRALYPDVDCSSPPQSETYVCAENPAMLLWGSPGGGSAIEHWARADDGGYVVPADDADGPVGTIWNPPITLYVIDGDTIEGSGTFVDADGTPETFTLIATRQ